MKKRIKIKWLNALRSGEYQQNIGGLREPNLLEGTDSFCCLGVLCNIHAQEHPEIAATQTNPGMYLDQFGYLPEKVAEWAGLGNKLVTRDDSGGFDIRVSYRNTYTTLANLNDEEEMSFKKIANVIERCL